MKKTKLLLMAGFELMLLMPACYKIEVPYVAPPAPIPDTLPALTTVGANTFGCIVNGEVWVSKADLRAILLDTDWLTGASINKKNLRSTMTAFQNVDALSPDGVKRGFTFHFSGKRGLYFSVPYKDIKSDSTHFSVDFF